MGLPILRARQTIAPIEAATGLSATVDSGLREVLAADLEMNTDARSVACYVDTTRAWMAGRPACRIPGSPEDGHDTLQRFDDAVGRIYGQTAQAGDSAALLGLPRNRAAPVDLPEGRGRRRRGPAVGRRPPHAQHRGSPSSTVIPVPGGAWPPGMTAPGTMPPPDRPALEHRGEEGPGTFGLGIVQDLDGVTGLADDAAVHEDQLVADLAGEAHLGG